MTKSIRRQQARAAQYLRAAANLFLRIVRKCLWPAAQPLTPERVCIYRIGNIGDIACAIPAMHAVRAAFPHARITLITSPGRIGTPGARELLDGAAWLDEILVYHGEDIATVQGRIKLFGELRQRRFDLWIELPAVAATLPTLIRNMAVAWASGARWGFGWQYERMHFAAAAQSEFIAFPDEVERLAAIVEAGGIAVREISFPIVLTGELVRTVDDALNSARLSHPLIALAPGAKLEPNRWPPERFVEVGRHLERQGCAVVIVGGAADAALGEQIARGIGAAAQSLAGRTTLLESCEVLRRCSLVVCNDSGVQHLAAAVGTPCVSLFACRDFKGKWRPHGAQHAVIRKWVECDTCFLDKCPYDNRCIKLIEVGEVITAADRKLAELDAGASRRLGPWQERAQLARRSA